MTVDTRTTRTQRLEHLKLLELCYRHAYLNKRRQTGARLSPAEQEQLCSLTYLLEGDPQYQRRTFKRFALQLQATVKTARGWCVGRLLDVSGAGMFLALSHEVEPGTTLQVRVGTPGEVEYLFSCTVVRTVADADGEPEGVGLSFCCVPLEMRRAA